MSHHHGIGKMFGPWLEGSLGKKEFDIFRTLKNHFDPTNVMNPGGTLGLDIDDKDKKCLFDDKAKETAIKGTIKFDK
jgi:alkyldihydroxyacetonephosphate synthase